MHVIINGNDSRQLLGVQVLEISPIRKPSMRRTIETIDGRDGDIVTNLGYAAYDRSIVIGLHDSFDIDRISQFFETSGTIVFSDEPSKYYNFQMIDEIDYEKLHEFRKATVKFHVQPYKYSTVDGVVSFDGVEPILGTEGWTDTVNNIYFLLFEGVLNVEDTASADTSVDVPVDAVFPWGKYAITYHVVGTAASTTAQLFDSDGNAVGEQVSLTSDTDVTTAEFTLQSDKTVDKLRITVANGATERYSLEVFITRYFDDLPLYNWGNTSSQPLITINGTGDIDIAINGTTVLEVTMPASGTIVVDAESKEATSNGSLSNRSVTGDYDNLYLSPGLNSVSFNGDVTSLNFEKYSRWI